jgi:hypothetical protein
VIPIRRLLATEPISKPLAIGARAVRPASAVLGPAAVRVQLTPFERALREAIAGLRESLEKVAAERDPLTRHLGFRALNQDAKARRFEPEKLSEVDDQQYARELLDSVQTGEHQSFEALQPSEREDLEAVLRFETRLQERELVSAHRTVASQQTEAEQSNTARLEREVARHQAAVAELPDTPKPVWLRLSGVAVAVLSLALLAVVWREVKWVPLLRWSTALAAMTTVLLGAWLVSDPYERRVWLLEQLHELSKWKEDAVVREQRANEELTRALKLFESVDAECQREEAAARAVFKRRPGVERYVSTSGAVIAFDSSVDAGQPRAWRPTEKDVPPVADHA